jgi:hypothetical protein
MTKVEIATTQSKAAKKAIFASLEDKHMGGLK